MGSDLAHFTADDLGRTVVSSLLTKTGLEPRELSEVIFGCAAQPYDAANIARVIALRSGIPEEVPAVTVHRSCASGAEAMTTAHQRIAAGQGDLFLVGGVESMTHIPFLFPHEASLHFSGLMRAKSSSQRLTAAASFNLSDFKPRIGLELGMSDPFTGLSMGETAENLAREFGITRAAQDQFSLDSHAKALMHRERLNNEISPVYAAGKAVVEDEAIHSDLSVEELSKLPAIFDENSGSVTTGNSSPFSDGAVAFLVGTEQAAERIGIDPIGRLAAYAYAGCDPARMGLGPVHAILRAKQLSGLSPEEAGIFEIHEAFAAQVLAVLAAMRDPGSLGLDLPAFEIPTENLNRRGGSIALGHPAGASSARLVLTALDQLHETGERRALVCLCAGGGQGAALYLEKP